MQGQFAFHFAIAILLTAVVSLVILLWYRRAVSRSMLAAGGAPSDAEAWLDRLLATLRQRAADPATGAGAVVAAAVEGRLRRRLAVVYGLGGVAAAVAMAMLFLLAIGGPFLPVRTFATVYAFGWPIVPTLAFLLGHTRARALLAFAAYAAAGVLLTVALSGLSSLITGSEDTLPLRNGLTFLQFMAFEAWLPYLIILATSARRIRAVAPFVLAGLLVFSFGNLAAGHTMVAAMDVGAIRRALLSLGGLGAYNAWYMLAALPIGYACWQGLRWLGRLYERKAFSDAQLLVDAWWLIVSFSFGTIHAASFGAGGLVGLAAFLAYRVVVAVGLALWPTGDARLGNRRLLLLRVFGFQRRTERLFDGVAQRWRWLGSVRMIAGADLATRIIGPGDLISFLGGRLRQLFLRRDRASFERLGALDEARDPDGRFRVNKVYCHSDSWQPALRALLATSDLVLMDLRGFSERNQGCRFELEQLVAQDLVRRTVFVVDETTDTRLLETALSEQAAGAGGAGQGRGAAPVTMVVAKSGSAADADRVYDALRGLLPA